jgi:hypothetical protein
MITESDCGQISETCASLTEPEDHRDLNVLDLEQNGAIVVVAGKDEPFSRTRKWFNDHLEARFVVCFNERVATEAERLRYGRTTVHAVECYARDEATMALVPAKFMPIINRKLSSQYGFIKFTVPSFLTLNQTINKLTLWLQGKY